MSDQGPIPLEGESIPLEPEPSASRPALTARPRPACPKCAARLPSDASLCTNCGHDLRKPPTAGKQKPAHACRHCGYDLKGLPEGKCPECGRPFSTNRLVISSEAEGRRVARHAYIKPAIMAGVGLAIGCLFLWLYGRGPEIPWWIGSFIVKVPVGLGVYFLCCLLWIGFDQPAGMAAIQLTGVYALVESMGIVLAPVTYGWVIPLGLTLAYIALLERVLDLEWADAAGVAISTTIAMALVGLLILKFTGGW